MAQRKDFNRLIRDLRRAGFTVDESRRAHPKVTHPEKPGVVFLPGTAGGGRALANAEAQLRRTFGWRRGD